MSKTWYPVINYEKCAECGACVNKCTHGVYNKEKAPRPVVVKPEGCVQGCKGCGKLCPNDAIEYFGDVSRQSDAAGCSCGK
jgi:NAD-dependent dihydropyrimidine dehydrogenase PreA subunit